MKKRWLCLFVENDIGVLALIAGLFSGKAYNLNSLTVGITEDETVARMTISLFSDDQNFEQVKKQLNRTIEVIKLIDCTNESIYGKEIMFLKIGSCTEQDKNEIMRFAFVHHIKVVDFNKTTVIIECIKTEDENNKIRNLLCETFHNTIEIVRGGSVAIESI